jgi:hypothetical protein
MFTLVSEEAAGDVDVLATNNNDFLPLKDSFGNNCRKSA